VDIFLVIIHAADASTNKLKKRNGAKPFKWKDVAFVKKRKELSKKLTDITTKYMYNCKLIGIQSKSIQETKYPP
jgi:hypothetical protein